ncbi:MAG: hypothetical protein JRI23_07430 [Deltaproteobacteria bacterium]|nr:hypothetical protein [Deltaproteobacteria bacterium]MBW2531425.1 hypothetical protein [Deltaproteobacteria bacterium]
MRLSRTLLVSRLGLVIGATGALACNDLSGVNDYGFGAPESTATSSGMGGAAGTGGSGGSVGGAGGGTATGSGGADGGSDVGGFGGAPLTWTVVDTLIVPAIGTDVVSDFVLQDGVGYRLRASGVCIPRYDDEGDAEWYDFADPKTLDTAGVVDVGIGIDDPIVDGNKTPFWGPYDATHVYEVEFVGKGAPITAKFHDPSYTNGNAGHLTVEVLALQ